MTGDFSIQIIGVLEGEDAKALQYKVNDFVHSLYYHDAVQITGCTVGMKPHPERQLAKVQPPSDFLGKLENSGRPPTY